MPDSQPFARPPLTLIVSGHEWHARTLESILGPHGYAVLRAYNGKQALERASSAHPDIIFLDTDLPDIEGTEICRQLRRDPAISRATPIIMTSAGQPTRQRRLDALRAGAWDYIGATLDAEELPLRLSALVRAKQETDRVREESLLDEITGLYNLRGIARRAREIGSQAFRHKDAFACLVISPVASDSEPEPTADILSRLASVLTSSGRTSDVVGTIGPGEFAIVAQGTDRAGAERLAARLAAAAEAIFNGDGVKVAIGYDAVDNYSEAPIDPSDMLMRASTAMRSMRSTSERRISNGIRRFDDALN